VPWTPEELAEMAAADAEIEANFSLTEDERRASDELDALAMAPTMSKNRDIVKERKKGRDYYAAHRGEICAKNRAYYAAHRDEISKASKKRYQERKRRERNAKNVHLNARSGNSRKGTAK
jgi:hypothetical protein